MKRLLALLFVAALGFTACGNTESVTIDVRPTDEPVGFVDAGDDPPTQSEARIIETSQIGWAEQLGPIMDALWMQCGWSHVDYSTWPDDQKLRLEYHGDGGSGTIVVQFESTHYDPELSKFVYGHTTVDKDATATLGGHSYLFDLTQEDEPGKFNQTDTVTLEQERSVSLTTSTDFNFTVENETKVSGGYAGVGLEDTLKETFGFDFSEERSQAESESKSKTEEHSFDVDLTPRKATLILSQADNPHTSTPFDVHGVWDAKINMTLPRPCGGPKNGSDWLNNFWKTKWEQGPAYVWSHNNVDTVGCWGQPPSPAWNANSHITKDCTVSFEGTDRIDQMLRGSNERWPDLDGWYDTKTAQPIHGNHDKLVDPSNRYVTISGTQSRVYEDSLRVTVSDVTGQDLDKVLKDTGAHSCDPALETCGG